MYFCRGEGSEDEVVGEGRYFTRKGSEDHPLGMAEGWMSRS